MLGLKMRLCALTMTLLLGGCAVGGALQTGADLGPRAPESAGVDVPEFDLTMTTYAPKGEPRLAILALHGFGDHARSTFAKAGPYWAERGAIVYAYDQRGFGHNPSRGRWPGQAALIEDFAAALAFVRRQHPRLPVVALGHSMGGAVVLAGLGEGLARPDASVLLAPAVWGGDTLGPGYRMLAWTMSVLMPDARFTGEGVVRIQASDNLEALRALGRDPLYVGPPSPREFLGLIRLTDRALAALPAVTGPVLMVYGAHDEVIPPDAIEAAYARLGGHKSYLFAPEGWHLLMRDLHAESVLAQVWDWIAARGLAPPPGN
ncbi:MAG: alpha/beta hydrolase [Neomegalonema sp.]|nr:alpha/beta hydrolase [Neomegalonema sp.]